MKKKTSLRLQLIGILLGFVVLLMGTVYFVQTTFLDDFYRINKIKSIESVGKSVAEQIGDSDFEDIVERAGMTNEVCIRVVSNNSAYSYTGACTLRGLDNSIINLIAQETMESADGEKLFDDFRYQRRPDENPEKVFIYSKFITYNNEPVMVLVSTAITPLSATISTLKSQYFLISIALIVMTVVLALIISRIILRPVKQISEESRNLSRGEYDGTRVRTDSREMSELNETLIRANEDIQKADKAKKELLGNVSHDLRTPLTMIVGYGEMIRDLPEENTEENLNVIIEEAKRLSTLVDDLIDISKIDTAGVELNKEDIRLNALLEDVYHQYQKYCESQDIDFSLKLSEDDPLVNIDIKRIKQILYNFINNSLNYNSKKKQKIILGTEKMDDVYRVYVYDNGEGIEAKDIQNIWDRYYKVDKEHRRHHIGSGIGLSLSRDLLNAHGLNYGVESEPKKYSRFYFDIPGKQ